MTKDQEEAILHWQRQPALQREVVRFGLQSMMEHARKNAVKADMSGLELARKDCAATGNAIRAAELLLAALGETKETGHES